MNELFLKTVEMSITASWLVLAVIAIRAVFRKIPKWILCLFWGLVAVRLICPFSIESRLSLVPDAGQLSQNASYSAETGKQAIGDILDSEGNVILERHLSAARGEILDSDGNVIVEKNAGAVSAPSVAQTQSWISSLAGIWLLGITGMLVYTLVSYCLLKRKVATAIPVRRGIKQSEFVDSSFVLGMIRPVIYLPFGMPEKDMTYVIAHEQAHIRRKDHWWKLLGFLLLTVHWFNPLMWLAYVLLCRDIELACDEKVIKKLGNQQRADYTKALLACSVNRRAIAACPLAFGEVGVRERVKSVLNYRKPSIWIVIVAEITCIAVAVCFLTNPVQENANIQNNERPEENVDANSSDAADTAKPSGTAEGDNMVIQDAAYYLELASGGKSFQNMSEEQTARILEEYDTLLDDYTLFARESTDNRMGYILGYYHGDPENNPFAALYTMEFSLPESDSWQLLYQESDNEAINKTISEMQEPEAGYVIKNSYVHYASGSGLIMIQPRNLDSSLASAFAAYLSPGGRDYIADAVSRGIALGTPDEPYLTVYLVSEKYGEISEKIPLGVEEAAAIAQEERRQLTDGYGFAASLHADGETVYYTQSSGVPQTVLDLAVEKCDYRFADPSLITGPILEAELDCDWLDAPVYANKGDLERLREILVNAEFGYVGSCGYGAKLTLTLTGGEKLTVFKGCDGCDTMVFGSYGGYFIGDSENGEFWNMFGLDADTKELLE